MVRILFNFGKTKHLAVDSIGWTVIPDAVAIPMILKHGKHVYDVEGKTQSV